MRYLRALVLVVLSSAVLGGLLSPALAQDGRITVKSPAPFGQVAEALERAVADEKMGLVCHANAQRAAAGRGVRIKGNQVLWSSGTTSPCACSPRIRPRDSRRRSAST